MVKINSTPEYIYMNDASERELADVAPAIPPNASRIAADFALLQTPITSTRPVGKVETENDELVALLSATVATAQHVEELEHEEGDAVDRKARRAARKLRKSRRDTGCGTNEPENEEDVEARKARRAARRTAKAAEAEATRKAGKAAWAEKKKMELAECLIFEKPTPPKHLPPL